MGFKVKRATWRVALGLLGLVSLPLGVRAEDSDTHLNLSIFAAGTQASEAAEITITPTNLIPTFASVTAPKISAVDLFSNQSVFSLTSSAYNENTPISSLRSNSDEAQFWQFTTLGGSVTIGMPSQTQQMLAQQSNYAMQNASWINSNLDTPAGTSKMVEAATASLGIPTLADGHSADAGNSSPTTATSLSSAAQSASLVALANPVVSPDVVRTAIPDVSGAASPVPEPASIAMIGLVAAGLLGRRRTTR